MRDQENREPSEKNSFEIDTRGLTAHELPSTLDKSRIVSPGTELRVIWLSTFLSCTLSFLVRVALGLPLACIPKMESTITYVMMDLFYSFPLMT